MKLYIRCTPLSSKALKIKGDTREENRHFGTLCGLKRGRNQTNYSDRDLEVMLQNLYEGHIVADDKRVTQLQDP